MTWTALDGDAPGLNSPGVFVPVTDRNVGSRDYLAHIWMVERRVELSRRFDCELVWDLFNRGQRGGVSSVLEFRPLGVELGGVYCVCSDSEEGDH